MSEKMYPIPFRSLMNWVVTEYADCGEIFGIHSARQTDSEQATALFQVKRAREGGGGEAWQ